jgi:hypothetical protein
MMNCSGTWNYAMDQGGTRQDCERAWRWMRMPPGCMPAANSVIIFAALGEPFTGVHQGESTVFNLVQKWVTLLRGGTAKPCPERSEWIL